MDKFNALATLVCVVEQNSFSRAAEQLGKTPSAVAKAIAALEEEQGCYEVLQQIAAVRGAVNGLMGQVLEGHIRDHMQPLEAEGEPEATEGLIKVLRSYLK